MAQVVRRCQKDIQFGAHTNGLLVALMDLGGLSLRLAPKTR